MSVYATLQETGKYISSNQHVPPQTVIVPSYGGISYSTLQKDAPHSASQYRSFTSAYGAESECGKYYQRGGSCG